MQAHTFLIENRSLLQIRPETAHVTIPTFHTDTKNPPSPKIGIIPTKHYI